MNWLELLKQRRVWATIVGVIAFLLTSFKIEFGVDQGTLTDLLTNIGVAVSSLVSAGLALHSFLKPKK